ncbi:MAG: HAMP domain-containing sensor histidine kinase [Pseudomonadota bacterium]
MLFKTLSGRLLALTVAFVMLAEVLIFLPSVARFRLNYITDRLERAEIASLALLATPDEMLEPDLKSDLLASAGVLNIVLRRPGRRELVLAAPMPPPIEGTVNLQRDGLWTLLRDAVSCLFLPTDRVIRVIGTIDPASNTAIEITMEEGPMRVAMIRFGGRVLLLSLVISLSTALALFLAVRIFITRPMTRVAENMAGFRDDPEDARRIIQPTATVRELAAAEEALMEMQSRLTGALKQKERMAALGGAVARISHDLRNLLTTAQLLADRIDASHDPGVQRVAPRLLASLDRAIALCERTLEYGRTEEPLPELRRVALRAFVDDLADSELLRDEGSVVFETDIASELIVDADPDQLYRILSNLIRNAREAIESAGRPGRISVGARKTETAVEIHVHDTGPGLPSRVLDDLFKPFRGSAKRGGSGLGLAIAAELARGHGGALTLVSSSTEGTRFCITLPDRAPAP